MNYRRTYEVLKLPTNLDIENLLNENPPIEYKGVNADRLAHLCHTIARLETYYKDDMRKPDGFVPLHAPILLKNNYAYRSCLDYLLASEVIICDEKYYPNVSSKGYQFARAYKGFGFKDYEIKTSIFKRRIRILEEKELKEDLKSCRKVNHLNTFFDPKQLKIDQELAYEWIATEQMKLVGEIEKKKISNIQKKQQVIDAIHKCDLYKLMVDNFQRGHFHCHVDNTSFRFHSSLTNIKKELRNFITFNDQQLVSLDIRNSQPFLTTLLFDESFYSKGKNKYSLTLNNIFPELCEYLNRNGQIQMLKQMCRQAIGENRTITDFEKYKKSVVGGNFYYDLSEEINRDPKIIHKTNRDKIKKQILTILYADSNSEEIQNISFVKRFKEIYPNVYEVFSILKQRSYNEFAWLMQRIESRLVLNITSKRFHRLFPNDPIFTIHDCMVTTIERKNDLNQILESTIYEIVGEKPKVKEELWTGPQKKVGMDKREDSREVRSIERHRIPVMEYSKAV